MAPRRIPPSEGLAAVAVCRDLGFAAAPRSALGTAVRFTLHLLAAAAPGGALEVRVPPFAAIQCLPGPAHRRGTPPSVVETDPVTWLSVALGDASWADALASGAVVASGRRADLAELLPLHLPPVP
ncbi:MAG: sterol carrier family protein [Dermatophilaceae bacterium]